MLSENTDLKIPCMETAVIDNRSINSPETHETFVILSGLTMEFLRCLKGICYYVGRSAPFSYGFDSFHYTWQIVAHFTFEKYDTMLLRVVCRLLWIVLLTS